MELNKFIELKGEVLTYRELSNELLRRGAEDICDFGNIKEVIESGTMVVATDYLGEEHIQIHYEVIAEASEDEVIETTLLEITYVEEF